MLFLKVKKFFVGRLNMGILTRILWYKQNKYFNGSLNGFIYSALNNSDNDCSLYIYNDLNDIYLEDIQNNNGNLKEKNWKTFNYTSGEIYFLITNFKLPYFSLSFPPLYHVPEKFLKVCILFLKII